jgi:radical SAM-linked protein
MSEHMKTPARYVLRVRYGKLGRLRYLGHLDLLKTIDRCIRRAGLPFALTQGFSPRMKIAHSRALPLGAASTCEYFDLTLTQRVPLDEAFAALAAATPQSLAPVEVHYLEHKLPALDVWLNRSRWRYEFEGARPEVVAAAFDAVMAEGSLTYLRGKKEKVVDLHATIKNAQVEAAAAGELGVAGAAPEEALSHVAVPGAVLTLEVAIDSGAALRPEALIGSMRTKAEQRGEILDRPRVVRVAQWHEEEAVCASK